MKTGRNQSPIMTDRNINHLRLKIRKSEMPYAKTLLHDRINPINGAINRMVKTVRKPKVIGGGVSKIRIGSWWFTRRFWLTGCQKSITQFTILAAL